MRKRGPARTKVKDLLDSRGVRYSWLADKLGIQRASFTRIEAGFQFPPPRYYERIAELLGVPLEAVVPDDELEEYLAQQQAAV